MWPPKLACCNFIPEVEQLRQFALDLGLQGVDWTIDLASLPLNSAEEQNLAAKIHRLHPLEVRLHAALPGLDLGDDNPEQARVSAQILQRLCRLAARLRLQYLTIHLGLGRESTASLEWEATLVQLRALVRFASRFWIRLCLENLAWGWTSRPDLFEKLVRKTGAWATFDLGHAQVCQAVASTQYTPADFVLPQPERVVNAHVYHLEDERGHLPPTSLADLAPRLDLLRSLPLCDWWVLELHDEAALRQTLSVVQEYLQATPAGPDAVRGAWTMPLTPSIPGE